MVLTYINYILHNTYLGTYRSWFNKKTVFSTMPICIQSQLMDCRYYRNLLRIDHQTTGSSTISDQHTHGLSSTYLFMLTPWLQSPTPMYPSRPLLTILTCMRRRINNMYDVVKIFYSKVVSELRWFMYLTPARYQNIYNI